MVRQKSTMYQKHIDVHQNSKPWKISDFSKQNHPARSIIWILLPLYYGTKVLGLSPYRKTKNGFARSILGSVPTLCTAVFFFCNAMRVITYFFFESNNIIVRMTIRVRIYLGFISTLWIYVNEIRVQSKISLIIETLKKIDLVLLKMGIEIPYNESRKRVIILVLVFYVVSVGITILDYTSYWNGHMTSYRAQFTLLFVIPIVVHSAVTCIFCTHIALVKQRFSIINERILQCILNIQKQKFSNGFFLPQSDTKDIFEETIMQTKDIHYKLCLLLQIINSLYSIPILFTLGLSYCTIFTQLFYWFTEIREGGLVGFTILSTIHTTTVMVLMIVCIVSLTIMCDACTAEAKRSALILFRINNYSNMTNVIRLFTLQIMELPRELTAAGFFNLDKQLLSAIFGSTATFLVILIQFDFAASTQIRQTFPTNHQQDTRS